MAKTKAVLLEETIEITKEYARGGGQYSIPDTLEKVYKKLIELDKDTDV